jgi:hypothetical protein
MKEATGELNMTIVTLVAISAIAALLWFVVWPMIQRMIVNNTCQTYGSTWQAVPAGNMINTNGSDAQLSDWYCCPGGNSADPACFGTSLDGGSEGEGE